MRRRWCRRPETTRADFGTGVGSFSSLVSLSSSLTAGWPRTRATTRASFSRLLEFVQLFRQAATAGVGHRTADFWQRLTPEWRLASRGEDRNRESWTIFIDLHETLCVADFCTTDHRDLSRSCNPTKPRGSPHHVSGIKET